MVRVVSRMTLFAAEIVIGVTVGAAALSIVKPWLFDGPADPALDLKNVYVPDTRMNGYPFRENVCGTESRWT